MIPDAPYSFQCYGRREGQNRKDGFKAFDLLVDVGRGERRLELVERHVGKLGKHLSRKRRAGRATGPLDGRQGSLLLLRYALVKAVDQ